MPAALFVAVLLAQSPAATTVDEVVVDGSYAEFRLVTDIAGDLGPDTLVRSTTPPMTCSGARWRYEPGPARQCWLRAQVHSPVRLEAVAPGRFGADWTVEWTGCAPADGGRVCELSLDRETTIGATFRRL